MNTCQMLVPPAADPANWDYAGLVPCGKPVVPGTENCPDCLPYAATSAGK